MTWPPATRQRGREGGDWPILARAATTMKPWAFWDKEDGLLSSPRGCEEDKGSISRRMAVRKEWRCGQEKQRHVYTKHHDQRHGWMREGLALFFPVASLLGFDHLTQASCSSLTHPAGHELHPEQCVWLHVGCCRSCRSGLPRRAIAERSAVRWQWRHDSSHAAYQQRGGLGVGLWTTKDARSHRCIIRCPGRQWNRGLGGPVLA